MTLVPLRLYFKHGRVKVALGLARGKQMHDKRETIKQAGDRARDARGGQTATMTTRVLITGAGAQLATALVSEFAGHAEMLRAAPCRTGYRGP